MDLTALPGSSKKHGASSEEAKLPYYKAGVLADKGKSDNSVSISSRNASLEVCGLRDGAVVYCGSGCGVRLLAPSPTLAWQASAHQYSSYPTPLF